MEQGGRKPIVVTIINELGASVTGGSNQMGDSVARRRTRQRDRTLYTDKCPVENGKT